MNVVDEISSGNRLRALIALRDELARRLPDAPSRELPVIARRLQSLLEEIEKLSVASTPSFVDEIHARYASRRAARLAGYQSTMDGENASEGEMMAVLDQDWPSP